MPDSPIDRRDILKLGSASLVTTALCGKSVTAQSVTQDFDIEYFLNYWGTTTTPAEGGVVVSQGIIFKSIGELELGPDTIVRIRNTETDREIEATPESSRAVSDDTQISCWDLYDHGELVEDPMISVLEDDWIDIDVSVEGDSDVFTSGSVFSTYQVEIIDADDRATIATTVETPIGIGFKRPAIQQNGTTGEIDLSIELPESLDESWYPEFSTYISDDGFWFQDTAIENTGTDTLEWTVDFSGSRPGSYDGWRVRIDLDEDAPGSRSVLTFSGILDDDAIVIESEEDDPTEIEDWYELDAIRNDLGGDYILVSDLDEDTAGYNDIAGPNANDGFGFEPIGTENNPFVGSFDGQDNEINGLHIDRPTQDAVGLFGIISGARVEPAVEALYLSVETIEGSGDSSEGGVGTVAGGVFGSRTISTVSATGTQISGIDRYVGGLIGSCWEATDVVIENSSANIFVQHTGGDGRAGGLVGGGQSMKITNCSASGDVDAEGDRIGGLVGNTGSGTKVTDSEATGDVKTDGESTEADGDRVGGLVGYLRSGSEVTSSSATGNVTGRDTVGGLIGLTSFDPPSLIQDCFAEGSVISTEEDDFGTVGGLIGQNQGEVLDSYATGDVTGQSGGTRGDYVGGLIGDDYGDIRRCFATGLVEGQDTVGGLVGSNDLVDGSSLDGVIENCYATGHVQAAASSDDAGGLVGKNWRSITTSFATGAVSGGENNGGLVGSVDEDAALTDSYWDTESTGQTTASGSGESEATGLTTDEMQGTTVEAHLSALDFEEIWQVETDPDNYPTLQAIDADHGIPDEEPDEPDEKHESGVDQDVFDAVDQDGNGEVTLEELVEANLERVGDSDGEVNGVEVTLEELVELNIWRLS